MPLKTEKNATHNGLPNREEGGSLREKSGHAKSLWRACAGIVLVNREGLIFQGSRIDGAGSAWQMPQGGIRRQECPQKAARRELFEETGVRSIQFLAEHPEWLCYELPDKLRERLWGGRYKGQRQRWFCFAFTGQEREINIHGTHPEFAKWRWSSANQVIEQAIPFKRAIYERVFAAFLPVIANFHPPSSKAKEQ